MAFASPPATVSISSGPAEESNEVLAPRVVVTITREAVRVIATASVAVTMTRGVFMASSVACASMQRRRLHDLNRYRDDRGDRAASINPLAINSVT